MNIPLRSNSVRASAEVAGFIWLAADRSVRICAAAGSMATTERANVAPARRADTMDMAMQTSLGLALAWPEP